MPTRRVVVLSYFGVDEGDRLVQALERGVLQRDVPVCIGSYGIAPRLAAQVADLPNTSYAPIFTLKRSGIWERRSLTPDEEKRLPRSSVRWAGPLPTVNALLELPTVTRLAWATELGRRYRDAIRTQVTRGVKIPSWQLDEVVSQAAGSRGWRDLVRGVLGGLSSGRAPLGDTGRRGVVWVAHRAAPLAGRPVDDELDRFWQALDGATDHLAGEEFPSFVGDPRAAAHANDSFRRALAGGGPRRRSLAAKYAAGLTPGLDLRPGLGGNVGGLGPAAVRRWRSAYLETRVADGVGGFGEFDFRRANGTAAAIAEVLRELDAALHPV